MVKKKKRKEKAIEKTKETIKATLIGERVVADENNISRELYDQSRFGEHLENKKFQYSLIESLYLLESKKLVIEKDKKKIGFEEFVKYAESLEPNFWIRYCVYKDLRKRGYVVKTALKFGADFRVYDRGIKPGEDHAKWIVFPVHEGNTLTWHEFSAKNRVAHSTRKRLLLAIVDEENDCTFYEIKWTRP
jgi:tRNA-intron endonuclease